MEKKLTHPELLKELILKAYNPFCTCEKSQDIRSILETSNNFNGMNHLYLASCYFDENKNIFSIDKKECLEQIELALKEGNKVAYFYFFKYYLSLKEYDLAKKYLDLSIDDYYVYAYYEKALLYFKGIIYQKDLKKAYVLFKYTSTYNIKDSFFMMVLIDAIIGDYEKEKEDYLEAKKHGVYLPGIVR